MEDSMADSQVSTKNVYRFREGNKTMKALLGGKGANLAEMTSIGLPVPPGFTITTEVCNWYSQTCEYPESLTQEVDEALADLEKDTGKGFGDPDNPLLLSVRSGAPASMPGMMDTILNLGLNDTTVHGVIAQTGDARFAYDCYRRFVAMYGDVVMGCKPESKEEADPFEVELEKMKRARGVRYDTELSADDLKELVGIFKRVVVERTGETFPDDPRQQLWGAIGAVFASWNNDRAIAYRRLYDIPDTWGTAVNVQAMVYGNSGDDSGTGVAFTRDPASGENVFYGEFLVNAQGEDVVAGVRTPRPVSELKEVFPAVYEQLLEVRQTLERELRDMQDFEFTVEHGRLFMLQTRNGKRTGLAAIRIAVEMAEEGLITPDEALMRVEPEQLNQLLRPIFSPAAKQQAVKEGRVLARGLPAGPGAAAGRVVFTAPDAVDWAARGEQVLLVRDFTSPEDIRGMSAAQGILTAQGGMTSHAALVARQMGKVCVVGCADLAIDMTARSFAAGETVVREGDWVSIDGFTGEVIVGQLETRPSEVLQVLLEGSMKPEESQTFRYYEDMMKWADARRRLGVRANADQPDQAANAVAFGAEGIGLCRTEHMFFGDESEEGRARITAVREMILAETEEERERALAKLLPMQRQDFIGIFRVMGERHVTIRTLDPPLHEFLPHDAAGQEEVARQMGVSAEVIAAKVADLHENNPMLGLRGCRLGILFPEITRMQVRAILQAACAVKDEGIDVHPEIMIPLVGSRKELEDQVAQIKAVAETVFDECGSGTDYLVGTMIEVPRAALTADEVAEVAEFFSFGTNDLTQMTFGISRDDAGKFVSEYLRREIWPADPFASLDQTGVGQLVALGVQKGRSVRPSLKVGICGEHGGDPESVKFCHRVGMDYVSCSPFRLPVARLAAAQAAIEESGELQLEK
jgi:pyruvate,orthophosphate dikinase